jgi:hypothetical protein
VSFAEINSALAAMDELQHSLLLGRRVEINFNRFRNAGRQWTTSSGPSTGASYGDNENRQAKVKGAEIDRTGIADGDEGVNDDLSDNRSGSSVHDSSSSSGGNVR